MRIAVYAPLAVVVILVLLEAQSSGGTLDFGERNPKALPEVAQLDFLVGEWKLATLFYDGNGKVLRKADATLKSWYILDGHGFQVEERHQPVAAGPSGDQEAFVSTAIFNYDKENKKWSGCSVNTLGNRKFLDGNFEDGRLVLTQDGKMFRGRKGKNRLIYSDITKDSFSFQLDLYDATGDRWYEKTYAYTAKRIR